MNTISLIYILAAWTIVFAALALVGFLMSVNHTYLTPEKQATNTPRNLLIIGIAGIVLAIIGYLIIFNLPTA